MDPRDVPDDPGLSSFLQQVEAADEISARRKGEIPRDHPQPSFLVAKFDLLRFLETEQRKRRDREEENHYPISQTPPAYLPCIESVANLQPLAISDMKLEEHHRGKKVTVRTLTLPHRMNNVINLMAIAEDEEGTAVLLQLYNQPEEAQVKAEDLLPPNSVCVIKEPFFKVMINDEYTIRVDHVTDILLLPKDDERIPREWRSTQREVISSEATRLEGNEAVPLKDWGKAERLYTEALSSATNIREQVLALQNRSLASLRLGRPEKALDDALRSRQGGITEKGLLREAMAHHGMEQFSLCQGKLRQLLKLNPKHEAAKEELEKVEKRLREEKVGKYDWKEMHKDAKKTPPLIDCATYSLPVEVRPSPGRGNGLFTTKAVKAGDLLLCEKAFSYIHAAEDHPVGSQNLRTLLSADSKKISTGGRAALNTAIIQKLHHNPQLAMRFTGLHHGDYRSAEPIQSGEPLVDTFLVENIVRMNSFSAPRTSRVAWEGSADPSHQTCGIWTLASRINHSCRGNCQRSFIGDMMIVRAINDLDAGSELLFCYSSLNPGEDYQATQKDLQTWGFVCQCELCEDKKAMSKQTFRKRQGLLQDLDQAMKSLGDVAQEAESLRLLAQLETCYPKRIGAPRLELWNSYLALSQKLLVRGTDNSRALELVFKALEAIGYVIAAAPPAKIRGKPTLEVKRWGQVNSYSAVAFIVMFRAYKVLAPELCEVVKSYARTACAIDFGEHETAGTYFVDLK